VFGTGAELTARGPNCGLVESFDTAFYFFHFVNRARFLIYILKDQLFVLKYTLKTFTH